MLGSRIAELRHRAGLSQTTLASRLNISPSTLGMYEQGRRTPSASTLVALANELGVTTDALLLPSHITAQAYSTSFGQSPHSRALADILLHSHPPYPFSKQEFIVLCISMLLDG